MSVLVPCFNESKNIVPLCSKLNEVFEKHPDYTFDILFVDDGSVDDTVEQIKQLANCSQNIKLIELSRNFGKEVALTAGIHEADCDALIIMDSDMQHPPEIISSFIKEWESGFDIVATKRIEIENRSFVKKIGSKAFYRIMSYISETEMVSGSTDFRLLDRKVVVELKRFTERNRLVRGMIDWVGYNKTYVEFSAPERLHGEAGYTLSKLFKLAVNSITSFSLLPLRIAGFLGGLISLVSTFLLFWMLIDKVILGQSTFTSISYVIVVNTFLIGLVLICLGFIALYIGNIHVEVVNRPLFIVKNKTNI
ncbi:glycosyltransferase family 2 protein [Vibrio cholerae]|uniref:glycosyltransferase family 2 protein n=1 Tax=Vibrio cholerae TaxID=666 RepID=UPI000ADBDC39|nr:glycosyltransferase family 2 protein [Vibrio cholerae]